MAIGEYISYFTFLAKPVFKEGEFRVEYKDTFAVLSWPVPSGIFTRQTIQKTIIQKKTRREVKKCQGGCVEEEVPLNQTTHITQIEENKEYEFRLVLYDGEVEVQSWENPVGQPASSIPGRDYFISIIYRLSIFEALMCFSEVHVCWWFQAVK